MSRWEGLWFVGWRHTRALGLQWQWLVTGGRMPARCCFRAAQTNTTLTAEAPACQTPPPPSVSAAVWTTTAYFDREHHTENNTSEYSQ